jgi:hypothetical protein
MPLRATRNVISNVRYRRPVGSFSQLAQIAPYHGFRLSSANAGPVELGNGEALFSAFREQKRNWLIRQGEERVIFLLQTHSSALSRYRESDRYN